MSQKSGETNEEVQELRTEESKSMAALKAEELLQNQKSQEDYFNDRDSSAAQIGQHLT